MPKQIYRNVSDTLFHAFLAFGSLSRHFHHTNRSLGAVELVMPRWTNSKIPCLQTAFETHTELGFPLQDRMLLKHTLEPHF